jgi:hypothetical protein
MSYNLVWIGNDVKCSYNNSGSHAPALPGRSLVRQILREFGP